MNKLFNLLIAISFNNLQYIFAIGSLLFTKKRGGYLTGDTTSWVGGSVEGALHRRLDAAMAIIKKEMRG